VTPDPGDLAAAGIAPVRASWLACTSKLRHPWHTARDRINVRHTYLVRLETAAGLAGFGECAPLPAAGTETPQEAHAALQELLPACRGPAAVDFPAVLGRARATPAARCAVESALLDLAARTRNIPLYRYLQPQAPDTVAVSAALGRLDAAFATRLRDALDRGFRVLKVKLGVYPPGEELQHLEAACRLLPAGITLRLDANGAWTPAMATEVISALAGLPVESLEEPLARPDPAALHALQARVGFPLALDESLAGPDREILLAEPPVRRLVLKPMVLGGLLPALELQRCATRAGLQVVVTSTLEGSLGLWAAAHLAAACDAGLAHGLATADWLVDARQAPVADGGCLRMPETPGLGPEPAPDGEWVDA
jgi:o-succinylbenzoate synthase